MRLFFIKKITPDFVTPTSNESVAVVPPVGGGTATLSAALPKVWP